MALKDILQQLRDGKISVDEAILKIRLFTVRQIESACLDVSRVTRKGVPEIIYAEGKTNEDLLGIVGVFLEETGRAIVTRTSQAQADALRDRFGNGNELKYDPRSRVMIIKGVQYQAGQVSGKVAIFSAGTADTGTAEEVKAVLQEMGCNAITFYDIGVAGMQRLFPAVEKSIEEDVDVIIVVAGMEGALASVVSGLVAVPVIGVPTSSGYGVGGKGDGALVSMLQSCSPGLVVVNIDNGVGAAVAAALIAKRASR